MIRPDGTQANPKGFDGGGAIDGAWGNNIDGNGDVWIGNIKNRSVVLLAGDNTSVHPGDTKAGDLLHKFTGGSIQMITDVNIDPAGNVWVANNWNSVDGVAAEDPVFATSTWGGGSGLTVIYGAASPVKPPRVGGEIVLANSSLTTNRGHNCQFLGFPDGPNIVSRSS